MIDYKHEINNFKHEIFNCKNKIFDCRNEIKRNYNNFLMIQKK